MIDSRLRSTLRPIGALGAVLAATWLAGCAGTPPPPPPEPEPEHWSLSRAVDAPQGLVTLSDPGDLVHHAVDPEGWYRDGFAITDDLAAGRFAAVLTGREGRHAVRVTSAPLDARERAVAGPSATLRLRVRERRLLLGGGDAWPSRAAPRVIGPLDERWLGVPNGDYRVTVTVLGDSNERLHDVVFRLEPIESIDAIAHAPGIPHLVVGREPAIAAATAERLRVVERCDAVPSSARWSPLVDATLPLPGLREDVTEVIESLHERGYALQTAMLPDEGPLVVAREARVGTLGVLFEPREWLAPYREEGLYRERFEVRGRSLCAVRIVAVEGLGDELRVAIEPAPLPREPLPPGLARALVERFESHVALANDPAWRYKSGWVRSAPDDLSTVIGVMHHLAMPAAESEALLLERNATRAERLIERMEHGL